MVSKMSKKKQKMLQLSPAYKAGRMAFIQGSKPTDNPYRKVHSSDTSGRRKEWFQGYYDQWRWDKWGKNEDEEEVALLDETPF